MNRHRKYFRRGTSVRRMGRLGRALCFQETHDRVAIRVREKRARFLRLDGLRESGRRSRHGKR